MTEQARGLHGITRRSDSNYFRPFAHGALRISDQILWSFAFFLFNFSASVVFEASGYAALAVSSSLAFILIAMVRACTTNARVVL
jgi:hypothetical protein